MILATGTILAALTSHLITRECLRSGWSIPATVTTAITVGTGLAVIWTLAW